VADALLDANLCDAIVMILVMIFPEVALYLPGKMR